MYRVAVPAQFFLALLCALFGSSGLEFALAPVLVAVYATQGQTPQCLGLIGVTALAGLAAAGFPGAIYFGCVSSIGIALGRGIASGRGYGTLLVMATAMGFAFIGLLAVASWSQWQQMGQAQYDQVLAVFDALNAAPGDARQEMERVLHFFLVEHLTDLLLGTLFVAVLFATSVCVSLTSVVLRRIYRLPGPFGAFREIRPPDALVWTVIALALVYLAYRQWPAPALLAIVGNAGVALAAIYALNGFAITVYAANLFPRFFAVILVVAAVMVLIYAPFFVLIGFFDTWGDFRNRMRTAKAAVKPPEE